MEWVEYEGIYKMIKYQLCRHDYLKKREGTVSHFLPWFGVCVSMCACVFPSFTFLSTLNGGECELVCGSYGFQGIKLGVYNRNRMEMHGDLKERFFFNVQF